MMGNVPTELRFSNRTQAQQKMSHMDALSRCQHPDSRSEHVRTDSNY